jgi:NADH-quinone oxidoreductase subunit H
MRLGWKVLIPISLGWILLVATVRAVGREVTFQRNYLLVAAAIVALIAVITLFLPQKKTAEKAEAVEGSTEFDAFAGGFPVPPPLVNTPSRNEGSSRRG